MKKIVPIILFATCLALAGYSHSTSSADNTINPYEASINSARNSKNIVFHGVVKSTDNGTILFTKDSSYPLIGGDFAMILDREVDVIGKIVVEDNVEKIAVARIQFERQ